MRKNNFSFGISESAFEDANEIALWYNRIVNGLGARFMLKLEVAFEKTLISPEAFSRYHKKSDIRKLTMSGFPYKIYYLFKKEHIEILAIIHMSRSKQFIKRKLR